jgi:hypothetical protein
MPKPDWSRKLSQPVDLDGQVLRTLADVRAHLMKLPEDRREWAAVQHITVPLRMSRHALRCE